MIDRTLELLATLEPETQARAHALISAARRAGIPMVIISGARTYEGNQEAGGATNSYHLSGRAFDVGVVGYRVDQISPDWWREVGRFAEANLGLYWGGRFLSGGRPDFNHFDTRRLFTEV